MIKINALKQTINGLENESSENIKEKELFENEMDEMKIEINNYQSQIGKYKEIARKAETNLDRIESLEEELRDKIRDNHQLQIKTRSLNQTIEKLTEKCDKQNEKIQQFKQTQNENITQIQQLKTDNLTYKQDNKLLNEKLNILLKENAENTLKNEKQIENIESYHLSKYKTLLKSFQIMKQRVEASNKLSNGHNNNNNNNKNIGYSNQGWKKYHEDHNTKFNFNNNNNHNNNNKKNKNKDKHLTYSIDLEMDEDEYNDNINDLNNNINELLTPCSSFELDNDNKNNNNKLLRKYQSQVKEYKNIIHLLQKQLKESKQSLEIEQKTIKKFQQQNKRLNKPKNINIDYLRNVLVKFLILTEYLTDEQVVLVPVLGSILNLSKTEKDMIDNAYNSNRYFMGTV